MELECAIQKYAWGVPGMKSRVALLAKASTPSLEVCEGERFAELWMGTHPNGPSVIKETQEPLYKFIKRNPQALGKKVMDVFGSELPFLFKVLSVNQALSIQAHPDKRHAEILHSERPEVYKDPNHKPEMTIALSPFQALCGFRPADQIVKHLDAIQELRELMKEKNVNAFVQNPTEENLQLCFAAMMKAAKDRVKEALDSFLNRLSSMDTENGSEELLQDLFLTLHNNYPGDVGCFSIYILNYLTLQPGQAMFLGPNVIHAYLLGDCIECMACSDNVVRAGLTPKYQDLQTLVSMLQYSMTHASERVFEGVSLDKHTIMFNPPVPEFAVDMIEVPCGVETYTLRKVDSASILLVVEGEGGVEEVSPLTLDGSQPPPSVVDSVKLGSVVFLSANQTLALKLCGNSRFLAFRALCVL